MSQRLAERAAHWLRPRSNRRDFIRTAAMVGTALAVAPADFILRPGSAYAVTNADMPTRQCPSGSICKNEGWHEFCCALNDDGANACPVGTIAGGWWKAGGSKYCAGPRYYIDCVGTCANCTTGCTPTGGFCPNCDTVGACDCARGDCNNRRTGCRNFRYGQCNQAIACVGKLACRVVSCTPAWLLDPTCTTQSATDDETANQHRPCLLNPAQLPIATPPTVAFGARPDGKGYWLVGFDGSVRSVGTAPAVGSAAITLSAPLVGLAVHPSGSGFWLATSDGGVTAMGQTRFFGSMADQRLNQPIVGVASSPTGNGYWLVASDGGIFAFGDAAFHGSTGGIKLYEPIVSMAATRSGGGYWLVASDGGVFAFGDAAFYGSTGGIRLNQSVVEMAATPTGNGYWLVALDGGVFSFGDAPSIAIAGAKPSDADTIGIATSPTGKGFWLVHRDGFVLSVGDAARL